MSAIWGSLPSVGVFKRMAFTFKRRDFSAWPPQVLVRLGYRSSWNAVPVAFYTPEWLFRHVIELIFCNDPAFPPHSGIFLYSIPYSVRFDGSFSDFVTWCMHRLTLISCRPVFSYHLNAVSMIMQKLLVLLERHRLNLFLDHSVTMLRLLNGELASSIHCYHVDKKSQLFTLRIRVLFFRHTRVAGRVILWFNF